MPRRRSRIPLLVGLMAAWIAVLGTPALGQSTSPTDIAGNAHAEAIDAITAAGIAQGCAPDRYCPDEPVRRDQMASFLARTLELEEVAGTAFADVPEDNVHLGAINALAEAGITQGCADDRFCPGDPVPRAEMASFLDRALELGPSEHRYFLDVADTHGPSAQRVAAAGISVGCDELGFAFCPTEVVQRDQMASFLARAVDLVPAVSVPMLLEPGDQGPAVEALQRRLEAHEYWVGPIDGVYGLLTEHAVLAIQKVHGLTRDGIYGPNTRTVVADPTPPIPRSSSGYAIEFDETRQVTMLVQDGVVGLIFHSSGGNEEPYVYEGTTYQAETPNGSWTIYREIDGWRTSHLGELYRPKYFHTAGIAFHGSTDVPAHAASHGCVRLSIEAMDWMWANDAMLIHADVLVYGAPS